MRVPRRADGVLDGLQHAAEGVLLSRGLRDALVEAAARQNAADRFLGKFLCTMGT